MLPQRLQLQVVGIVDILGAEAARLAVVVGRAGFVVCDLHSPRQRSRHGGVEERRTGVRMVSLG